MTKHEAAVISMFTGIMIGKFSDMHEYAEKIYGGPIWTHQFADKDLVNRLKELAKPDFVDIHEGITND